MLFVVVVVGGGGGGGSLDNLFIVFCILLDLLAHLLLLRCILFSCLPRPVIINIPITGEEMQEVPDRNVLEDDAMDAEAPSAVASGGRRGRREHAMDEDDDDDDINNFVDNDDDGDDDNNDGEDYDTDGDSDIIVSGGTSNFMHWFENNGSYHFNEHNIEGVPDHIYSFKFTDYI